MIFQTCQMRWMLLLVISCFVVRATCDFASEANALINNHKTVRLDPFLRRALLKALTELEEEAKLKADEEDAAAAAREAANNKLQEAVDTASPEQGSTALDEIQTTADTSYPTPSPAQTSIETVTPTTEAPLTVAPTIQYTTSPPLQTETQTSPPFTIQDAFFFQTPTPLDGHNSDLTKAVSLPDIESNLITEDKFTQTPQSSPSIDTREELTPAPTQHAHASHTTPKPLKQVQAPSNDNDVDIFKAPLVAAFTLHQDSKGTPKGVVPLFRAQNPTSQFFGRPSQQPQLPQRPQFQRFPQFPPLRQAPQNFLIQSSQVAGSFTLSPSQQLARLQQQPDQFSFNNNNNQFPPQNDFTQQRFQPSAGPFGFDPQIISGHQQLPSDQPPVLFNQLHHHQQQQLQQPGVSSVTVTTHSEFIDSNFPSSTFPPLHSNSAAPQGFAVSVTSHPQPVVSSTARPITSFQSSTPQTTFTIPPVTLPLQNEPRFQSPIIVQQASKETHLFLEEQQKRDRLIQEEKRLRQLEDQARQRLEQVTRQREVEENRLRALSARSAEQFRSQRQQQSTNFQRNLGFAFNPDPFQFQPNSNRVNRQEPFASTGNFGFNPAYRTIPDEVYHQRNFRSPQQELANFLYQSGVATHSTGQEDLNIVSKVLALNHERSDEDIVDSLRSSLPEKPARPAGFAPSAFSQPISRSDAGAEESHERRRDEKTLLVGEIKEFSGGR